MLARGIDLLAVDVELPLEGAQNPPGDVGGLRRVRDSVEQDGELVAAEPGDRVRRADGVQEALRHLAQDRVAGRVAEAVVDGLEVVEVDEHDADRLASVGSSAMRACCTRSANRAGWRAS